MHPVLLRLGPVSVYAYGLFLALAFIAGTLVAMSMAQKKGRDPDLVMQATLYIVVAAILGSRVLYILLNLSYYMAEPLQLFRLTEGGLSLHGGVLGGLLAGSVVALKHRAPFWAYADVVAPSIALGTGIARMGCFLNGCCYGTLTDVPWAVVTRYAPGLRHPAQIYEMLMDFALFGYLALRLRSTAYDGQVWLHYLIGYSFVRFLVEFFRDSDILWWRLSLAQVASVAIILGSLVFSLYLSRRGQFGQKA